MRELLPGLFTWASFSEKHGYDFNGHLVQHAAGNIAIDPVEPKAEDLDELTERGLAAIVITNRNHFRAAQALRERTGARVLVHPADADFVRGKGVTVTGKLEPGQRVGPFTVVAAPGKSPGEIALHWPERRILVIGDACVGKQPTQLGVLPDEVIDDPPQLRRTLAHLAAALDFDVLLLGDGHSRLSGGRDALRALVASFDVEGVDERLRRVLGTMFQAHPWHGLEMGDPAGAFTVYVEIVPTDVVKYELDKPSGHLRIDRPQRYSSFPPTLYGFLPQTYCAEEVAHRCGERTGLTGLKGDGDPIDVCVVTEKTSAHGGFLCRARAIGGLRMVDKSEVDDKIIAVLDDDVAFGNVRDLDQCPRGIVDRLKHYFLSYKQIPGEGPRKVQIAEVYGRDEAVEVIRRSVADYRTHYGAPDERLHTLRQLLGTK